MTGTAPANGGAHQTGGDQPGNLKPSDTGSPATHGRLHTVLVNGGVATMLVGVIAAVALAVWVYLATSVMTASAMTPFSWHGKAQQYVDALNAGQFSDALAMSNPTSSVGSKANGTARSYISDVLAPKPANRAHNWKVGSAQRNGSQYWVKLSYVLGGHTLTLQIELLQTGRAWGIFPTWSIEGPFLSKILVRVPSQTTHVSVNSVDVDLMGNYDSQSKVPAAGQCSVASCTDYKFSLFPGIYNVGLSAAGKSGTPSTVAVTAGGYGPNIDSADLSAATPVLLKLESIPPKGAASSLTATVKSYAKPKGSFTAAAYKFEGKDGGEADKWRSYSVSSIDGTKAAADSHTISTVPAAIPYLPVYLMAQEHPSAKLQQLANTMLANKDDAAGDQAIAQLGGVEQVNNWLAYMVGGSSFGQTLSEFAKGGEPSIWTTNSGGLAMISTAYTDGAAPLMHNDLAALGIHIPAGMTVHALHGRHPASKYSGVIDAVYGIVTYRGHTASVAITTNGLDQSASANMDTDVLANIELQLAKLN